MKGDSQRERCQHGDWQKRLDEQLTQEQFYRFDAAVNAFDKDLNGAIDTGELIRMLTDPKTRNSLCSLDGLTLETAAEFR